MATLTLKDGNVILVDDEDLELLEALRVGMRRNPRGDNVLLRSSLGRILYALRIGPIPPGLTVDHINRDAFDFRRENLRLLTFRENLKNRGPRLRKDGSRGYKGVQRSGVKWTASIGVDGKYIHLGTFESAKDAALAYDEAAALYCGPNAYLNFP